jgi:DNA-binding response OmpR family regulator
MPVNKTVVGTKGIDDSIGPALRESGFQFKPVDRVEDAIEAKADCFLIDARNPDWAKGLGKLKSKTSAPILSWVKAGALRDDLMKLHHSGTSGYVREGTPAEEIVIRVRAMLEDKEDSGHREARAARRVWFQQLVNFKAFDRDYTAWSTTLSETGIFLRTQLSFPL